MAPSGYVPVPDDSARQAWGGQVPVGTKFHWLRNVDSFSEEHWQTFQALRKSDLKTARAWALKETAKRLLASIFAFGIIGRPIAGYSP